jgi:hypothetical protein
VGRLSREERMRKPLTYDDAIGARATAHDRSGSSFS